MTQTQRTAIAIPAKGLLVYQNDETQGFYYYDGTAWTRLASGTFTETDPVFGLSPAHGITLTNISNWNSAYGWGNHAGLYRLVSYVPDWNEITSNPFSFSSVANNQLIKYNSTSGKWENWTPDFLTSYIENDPVYTSKFDVTAASSGDLLKFDGSKYVKFTPNITESNYLFNNKYGVKLLARNDAHTSVDFVISPKGGGGIFAQQPDGTTSGGDMRGVRAVDLQMFRGSATQVASGNYSFTIGALNTASGDYSIATGYNNTAQSYGESVLGFYATVGSGNNSDFVVTDRLFVIGNGSPSNRSDALTILKNANTTIGGTLTLNGNGTNASLTFPTGRGTSGQFLKTNANGTTQWANAVEPGTASGQMQYWNGTAWVTVAAGQNGQILKYKNGIPTWVDDNIENLSIGDFYKGGIIAYFLQSDDPGYDVNVRHGLIAATSDQSTAASWGCNGTLITGADGTALGTGPQNTLDIVSGCSAADIVARICSDLVLNVYSDWYLPSKDELNKVYLNKNAIGGLISSLYWSSSEYASNVAWLQDFSNGGQIPAPKDFTFYFRAVRAF
jgi:hypothetical protein